MKEEKEEMKERKTERKDGQKSKILKARGRKLIG